MAYELVFSDRADRQIEKMDPEFRRRFFKKIEKLASEPRIYGKPLRGPLAGTWELKLENAFRILFTINDTADRVIIEAIRHKDEF